MATLQDMVRSLTTALTTGNKLAVFSPPVEKALTLTLDTLIYASDDVLSETAELTGVVSAVGNAGKIKSVVVLDKDDQGQPFNILILKTNVSIGTVNGAVTLTDANAEEIVGMIEVASGDFIDAVNCQVAIKSNLDFDFVCDAALDDLFVATISKGTGTYTASGIVLTFFIEQE